MLTSERETWIGVGALAVATAGALTQMPADLVERAYSLSVYPRVQRVMTSATNTLPVAVLDVVLALVVIALVAAIVRAARMARTKRSVRPMGRLAFRLASVVAVAYVLFLVVWGLNYRRLPMSERLQLTPGVADAAPVLALGLETVRQVNSLHESAHRIGWREAEWRRGALTAAAATVQSELTGVRPAVPGRLKASLLGIYFRWTGVDGMVNPFGLEVIGNPDLLPFERPFVIAHEWAHLAGFADESEASLVGFLTCVRASTPEQYSGWLYLYWQVAGEVDGPSRARLWEALAPGPRADVEAIIARLRRGQLPRLRVASWVLYDQYLKANRVESGVRSYGAVVSLLVRARFEPGWVIVRRRG